MVNQLMDISMQKHRSLWCWLQHLWYDRNDARRLIPPSVAQELESAIATSELQHSGEIRIFIEGGLPWSYLCRKAHARLRAQTLFGKYGIWDTAERNGVLIYFLLADHAIEIVADRGVNQKVPTHYWQDMVRKLSTAFEQGDYKTGLAAVLKEVSDTLCRHFPQDKSQSDVPENNQLSNLIFYL